jgi:hypothetical protein
VDTLTWSWSRQLTVEEATGLQLSYSFSTAALLGGGPPALSTDIRAAVQCGSQAECPGAEDPNRGLAERRTRTGVS